MTESTSITCGMWVGARTLGGKLVLSRRGAKFVPNAFDRGSSHEFEKEVTALKSVGVTKRIAPYFVRRLLIVDVDGRRTYFQVHRPKVRAHEVSAWASEHGHDLPVVSE